MSGSKLFSPRDSANGITGADGATGDDGYMGQDGAGYEYVFARTATANLPGNQRPDDGWFYKAPVAVNGLLWTNKTVGTTGALPFEWESKRIILWEPKDGDDIPDIKGDFSDPIIAFRFAEPGQWGFAMSDLTKVGTFFLWGGAGAGWGLMIAHILVAYLR